MTAWLQLVFNSYSLPHLLHVSVWLFVCLREVAIG